MASLDDNHTNQKGNVLIRTVLLAFWMLMPTLTLAADASERVHLREGMSEGEVLVKVGKPDSESFDSGGGSKITVKRWIYLPHPNDQQTVTTVTLREGRVTYVSRQVLR